MPRQIRCVVMRGGTSKAVFLKEADIPSDKAERAAVILSIFGSPDRRQIDGLGGADPLTSKLAIIGPPRVDDARAAGTHLTYSFGQVEIDRPDIDWHSLCGNISAAVGAFGIYEGMVPPVSPITRVKVFNTNLKRVLMIEVPVDSGRPVEQGGYRVPGVPGSGAKIQVDFSDTAGGTTGSLLPTDSPIDRLTVPGLGEIDASLVDIGNAHVFVRARDVGMKGTESAAEIDGNTPLRDMLERIRGAGAERMGMIGEAARSAKDSPATPILGVVSEPADYVCALDGSHVAAAEVDLVSRLMFMQQAHKTYAGTSTACTGVASRVAGTVVHEMARRARNASLRIGHPSGVIETECAVSESNHGFVVERATLGRTARRILEGYVFVPSPGDPVA